MATERQAIKARQLLDDDMLNDALKQIDGEIISKLKEANLNGCEDSERYVLELARRLQSAAAFKKSLQSYIDNHKLAEFSATASD